MRILLIIVCSVLSNAIALENSCLPGWTHFKGDRTCLKAFAEPDGEIYPDALSICQGYHGYLAQIQDKEKNSAVFDVLSIKKESWIATWKPSNNKTYDLYYGSSKKFSPSRPTSGEMGGTRCRYMFDVINSPQWGRTECNWVKLPFVCETPEIPQCPDGWTQFKGDKSCIKVENDRKLSWHDAQSVCQQGEGDLFLPIEGEKANFVIGLQKMNTHYWVGFADNDEDGQFNLINGGNMTKTLPWRKREPNNAHGNEHCGEMKDGLLYDKRCGRKRNFVCELLVGSV